MLYVKGMARMAIYAGMASVGVAEVDARDGGEHEEAHDDEGGRGGKGGNCQEEGERNRGEGKENGYGDGGKTGPSAFRNASRTFYEGGRGGNADAAPMVVATASAMRAPLMRGSFPSSSSMFALEETPTRVPRVSKYPRKGTRRGRRRNQGSSPLRNQAA